MQTTEPIELALPANNTSLTVRVTDAALDRVATILGEEPSGTMLRVSVEGGGCSGFQYKYELTQDRLSDDLVLGDERATVIIDPISLPYLAGSVIDYKVSIMGAAFEIENPQATSGCGCGTSFSL